uniref:Uncharacterized protein n=1 Tax=Physcomitrium patens TaxID=3218 RepID=A0A2K1JH09_PHYPA|nr:hypothetical protein PHYPA_018202 [Physcomitrium patens]
MNQITQYLTQRIASARRGRAVRDRRRRRRRPKERSPRISSSPSWRRLLCTSSRNLRSHITPKEIPSLNVGTIPKGKIPYNSISHKLQPQSAKNNYQSTPCLMASSSSKTISSLSRNPKFTPKHVQNFPFRREIFPSLRPRSATKHRFTVMELANPKLTVGREPFCSSRLQPPQLQTIRVRDYSATQ